MGNAHFAGADHTHVVEHGSIKDGIMISEGHMHGLRPTQEDAAFVNIKNIEELPECSILGLFDGHGGPNVALYAARNFERVFRERLRLEVDKNHTLRGSREWRLAEGDVDTLANNMLEDKKKQFNADNDVMKLYDEDDKEKTFNYYNNFNNKNDVDYYHIQQYFYGIVDRKLDDEDCKEAFKKMLKWKENNINYSVNNIDDAISKQRDFIKNVFKNAFIAIDKEIEEKFFEWDVRHNCPTGCYKPLDKYYGRLNEHKKEAAAGGAAPASPADAAGDGGDDGGDDGAEGAAPADAAAAAGEAGEGAAPADAAAAAGEAGEAAAGEAAAGEAAAGEVGEAAAGEAGASARRETAGSFHSSWLQGCTAEVVLFTPMYVITAHAGDSRTIIVNNNGVVMKSGDDHKPTLRVEKERILKAAGDVVVNGRVHGLLSVSRGLGDFILKPRGTIPEKQMVSSVPDVEILDRHNIKFLATACDGVWDKLNSYDVTAIISSTMLSLKRNNALPTYLNKMSETVKQTCQEALRKDSRDNISLLLTYFGEDEDKDLYPGKISISTWDQNIVMEWVKSFYERSASHVDLKSEADNDAVEKAITAINNAFKAEEINGETLLSPELKKNIGFDINENTGEITLTLDGAKLQGKLAAKILDKELEIIKLGPKRWNLDWFEAWLEISLVDSGGNPLKPGNLVYIHFIKHMCNKGLMRAEGKTEVWPCESVEPYDKIGEIIFATDVKEIKNKFNEFTTYVAITIPKRLKEEEDAVEKIRAAARAKASETRQDVENMTDEELLPLVENQELRQKLVLYNEMLETLSLYKMAGYGAGSRPTAGNVRRFMNQLEKLQKGQYDWLKIKTKFDELKTAAPGRELMTTENAPRGGKKSRKLRRRTKGGKKSRKQRKRTTIKGGKRKRRRTRRRR